MYDIYQCYINCDNPVHIYYGEWNAKIENRYLLITTDNNETIKATDLDDGIQKDKIQWGNFEMRYVASVDKITNIIEVRLDKYPNLTSEQKKLLDEKLDLIQKEYLTDIISKRQETKDYYEYILEILMPCRCDELSDSEFTEYTNDVVQYEKDMNNYDCIINDYLSKCVIPEIEAFSITCSS